MQAEVAISSQETSERAGDVDRSERRRFLPTWTIAAAALTTVAIVIPLGPGAKALAILGIIVVPGSAAIAMLGLTLAGLSQRILIALVTGIAFLLGVGLVCAVVLKPLGVAHPLTHGPMLLVWIVVLAASIILPARLERDPLRWLLEGIEPRHGLWLLGLSTLPALALLGAARLNAGHGSSLATVVCAASVGILLLALASVLWDWNAVPVGPALFLCVVALVWQVSCRGNWLYGSDIQHEYFVANRTATTGQFALTTHSDTYQAMLSLTVLPAQLHTLTSASVEILLQLLPGVILGLVVVGALSIFRSLVSEGLAVGFALLFVGVNTALLTELPAVTRQCYGLLMFEAMIVLVVAAPPPIRRSRALCAFLGVAMAWSHYSTAFIAVPVLVIGWVVGARFRPANSGTVESQTFRSIIEQRGRVADRGPTVLSAGVVGVTVVAAILWGVVIAGSGAQLSQLRHSIETSGFALLPSSGGVLTRWLNAASSKTISAKMLQRYDQMQTKADRHWLHIDPHALSVHLVNASAPKRSTTPVLGPTSSALVAVANELILVASVVAVIISVVWLFRGRRRLRPELAGMALGAVLIDAIARVSGTVAQSFGPERVQAQLGVLLLVPLAVAVASSTRLSFPRVRLGVFFLAIIELAGTTGLLVVAFGGVPPATLSSSGENVERFVVTTPGLYTAGWMVNHAGKRIIQADTYGELALSDFTGGQRHATFDTVDPIAVDRSAWIYASPTNVVNERARGSTGDSVGVFAFPQPFYDQTRPIIFSTGTTMVYGSI